MSKILFLETDGYASKVVYCDRCEEILSVNVYLKHLASSLLFDITDYNKLARKKLGFKMNIPIYFSKNCLIFHVKIKEKDYYINYDAILAIGYKKNITYITFQGGVILTLHINHNRLIYNLEKCESVLDYVTKAIECLC